MFKEACFQESEQPGSTENAFHYSIIHIITTMKCGAIQYEHKTQERKSLPA
jgi:hypothetical protein